MDGDYLMCPFCKEYFTWHVLEKHAPKCPKKPKRPSKEEAVEKYGEKVYKLLKIPHPLRSKENMSKVYESEVKNITVFVGNSSAAKDSQDLMKMKITHVLNVSREAKDQGKLYEHLGIQHKKFGIHDSSRQKISNKFRTEVKAFFNEVVKAEKPQFLIHCSMGMSRSGATACLFLMEMCNLSLVDALEELRGGRKLIYPNKNFMLQLVGIEKEIFGKNTITEECIDDLHSEI